MKILVAPLNWGLGHASRCIPLVARFLSEGHEVVLGGDGDSLQLLRSHFPELEVMDLAPLDLHYGQTSSQIGTLLVQLPAMIRWCRADNRRINSVQKIYHFDRIVSDNRFGLFVTDSECETIYITHQLHICLPYVMRWMESLAEWIHGRIIAQYNRCWIPDYAEFPGLAGRLSHPRTLPHHAQYIGPLSRFSTITPHNHVSPITSVALISGLEPHRSLFEARLREEAKGDEAHWLFLTGRMDKKQPLDSEVADALCNADRIYCRSGYSTIMDLHVLGVLSRAVFTPTPGQSEQEYLYSLYK